MDIGDRTASPAFNSEIGPAGTGPILLAELTSPAFAAVNERLDLVLIPVGAHEQH